MAAITELRRSVVLAIFVTELWDEAGSGGKETRISSVTEIAMDASAGRPCA